VARHEMTPLVYSPMSPRKMNQWFITWHSSALGRFVEMPGIEPGSKWDITIIFMLSSFGIATHALERNKMAGVKTRGKGSDIPLRCQYILHSIGGWHRLRDIEYRAMRWSSSR